MPQSILVSTRKGLFVAEPHGNGYRVTRGSFIGDNVTNAMVDPRAGGTWYAALDHGHFGVKLHRSSDRGVTWAEIASPTYPTKPDDVTDKVPWSTKLVWALEIAPDAPGALWAGTIPGGLFRSDDRGDSWQLNEALWRHPSRFAWFGGGADQPGIHSICVDPRDSRRIVLGVSCGG